MLDGADEKPAGAAGGVEDRFAEPRVDLLDDELRDGARRVELAGVAGGLEVLQELLVDVAEHVAVIGGVEVDAVDLVDHLAHQRAVLHVVVGVLERGADQRRDAPAGAVDRLELGQQRVVDEVEQRLAGDAFVVAGPVRPAEVLRAAATCSRRGAASSSFSRSSKIFRKNIQPSCSRRCASP